MTLLLQHYLRVDLQQLVPLKDGEIIQMGDIVMDDFGLANFVVGNCHDRIGTPYSEYIDKPIMRSLNPIKLQKDTL